jgi:hypothetical protein
MGAIDFFSSLEELRWLIRWDATCVLGYKAAFFIISHVILGNPAFV